MRAPCYNEASVGAKASAQHRIDFAVAAANNSRIATTPITAEEVEE